MTDKREGGRERGGNEAKQHTWEKKRTRAV